MQNNRDILLRLRIVYIGAVLLGIAIVARAFTIGVVQRDQWLKLKKKEVLKHHVVEAPRGNIYAEDGSLLATSLPIYTVRLDFEVERLQKIYEDSIGKLIKGL
jgi:cell division protein FtsI (penicillin-binding protein 3)